jgi:hypothetical protein
MNFFEQNKWEECLLSSVKNNTELNFFGHIQNPDVRHTKGIVEYISSNQINYHVNKNFAKLLFSGIYDFHTAPLSLMYTTLIYKTHWIPIDLVFNNKAISCNNLTNLYFKKNNLPFKIYNLNNLHVSDPIQQQKQETVKKFKEKHAAKICSFLNEMLAVDVELWKASLDDYTDQLKLMVASQTR